MNRIGMTQLEFCSVTEPLYFEGNRDAKIAKSVWGLTHPLQAEGEESLEHITGTVPASWIPDLLPWVEKGKLLYRNKSEELRFPPFPEKPRLHLIGIGDVGAHCALGLRLLGKDSLSLGIFARDSNASKAFSLELSQIRAANQETYPEVLPVSADELCNCDILVFAASAGVPERLLPGQDVRMMQYESNKKILSGYLEQMRQNGFRGFLLILSDPVDALCNFAAGVLQGILPRERILGLGLGVMHARACMYAEKIAPEYPIQGRPYGPHGEGLWIANSLERYDDSLSSELTRLTKEANLAIRALGAKPFYGPALSSGTLSILSLLRGEWFYGAAALSDIYFGSRIRLRNGILYVERNTVPQALYQRTEETVAILRRNPL